METKQIKTPSQEKIISIFTILILTPILLQVWAKLYGVDSHVVMTYSIYIIVFGVALFLLGTLAGVTISTKKGK